MIKSGPELEAMAYRGNNRLRRAWLVGRATYSYTRSWDGVDGMDFGRWYCFTAAVSFFWEYLWKK